MIHLRHWRLQRSGKKILREQADKRRIAVSAIDMVEAPFLGLSPVEESEGAISFIDGGGYGRTLWVDGFELLAGQHDLNSARKSAKSRCR